MIKDPFYSQILERLDARLDDDIFEVCASSLLRKDFPTLVPIRGGTDSGMDGATASSGPFLVCTTGEDVIRNLTKSLKSYIKSGGPRRTVLLATSQELTQKRRTNLENRARSLGFHLMHIYDREAMAEHLYHEPRWCKELLDLTGRPSALTVIPRTERPLLDQTLIGREDDLRWLQESAGDRLLVGQPGCGKTFLLRSLALKGWGLFLVSEDAGAIADAVRGQQPTVIIVDDAHFQPQILSMLRQLRAEIMAEFDIVATSWEGDKDLVAEALALPTAQIHELELLTRDEIVEVIKHTGIAGPVELIREIVNQAEGRPGLAVTLSYLCLSGDVQEVVLGEALNRSLSTAFKRLVGREANEILGAFALGGDRGMTMGAVSGALGVPVVQLRASLVRLAAGGVLREGWEKYLSVWPKALRYVLVRDTFFSGKYDLPSAALMQAVPDKSDLAETLTGAITRGAKIPNIIEILESIGSASVWEDYAALGEDEAKFVLRHHPEFLYTVGQETLRLAPTETLPLLFKAAIGDERDLGHALDHPLRRVEDWIREAWPGKGEAIRRRRILANSVRKWLEEGNDECVGLRALCLAFRPTFESYKADPGSGMTINITSGLLTEEELVQIKELWGQTKDLIAALSSPDWKDLFSTIHQWAYPESGRVREAPQNIAQLMRSVAAEMIKDVAESSREHPGVQHWAANLARTLRITIHTVNDPEFEVLFPEFHDREEWRDEEEQQRQAVLSLAERWRDQPPAEVASKLVRIEKAAAAVNKSWPRWTIPLCELIAGGTTHPNEWLKEFIDKGMPADAGEPFLRKTVETRTVGWEDAVAACFDNPSYEWIAVNVLLTLPDIPTNLLSHAFGSAQKYPQLVHILSLRDQVPKHTLRLLFSHNHPFVSTQAAIGTWCATPKGEIRESIAADWRAAVLRAEGEQFWLTEILKSDGSLAFEWLMARMERKPDLIHYHVWKEVEAAISVLSFEQKAAVLQHVEDDGYVGSLLISELAGDDLRMYGEILRHSRLSKFHLSPLNGHPTGSWTEKATLALEAGYSPKEVAGATLSHDDTWTGPESGMWQGWIGDFEMLSSHTDPRIREVGQIGAAKARERQAAAAAAERREAVYGR
jgi:hypothetical protein